MEMLLLLIFLLTYAEAVLFCEKTKMPLEVGQWRPDLKRLDSAAVENNPVSISEGQVYVYENYFPGYEIKYVHVDNVARRTCGASAHIKSGGIGSSSLLIILHADSNQEIRSVVDVWGVKGGMQARLPYDRNGFERLKALPVSVDPKNIKSAYLFEKIRVVNHNAAY